jgi:hypothetical protein
MCSINYTYASKLAIHAYTLISFLPIGYYTTTVVIFFKTGIGTNITRN